MYLPVVYVNAWFKGIIISGLIALAFPDSSATGHITKSSRRQPGLRIPQITSSNPWDVPEQVKEGSRKASPLKDPPPMPFARPPGVPTEILCGASI